MNEQAISLTAALGRGWDRMVQMLFKPFDVTKWLVVAFTAWLAGLADGGGGGGGGSMDIEGDGGEVIAGAESLWEWLSGHELMAGMIAGAVLLLVALIVLVLWLSSRGKFMFLDNVVHDRGLVQAPWHEYRREGNSLFAFRIVLILLCVPLVIGLVALFGFLAFGPDGWVHQGGAAMVAGVAATAVLCSVTILTLVYLLFFLDAFVVPLMYAHRIGVVEGWRRFFAHFWSRPGWFLLAGLFVFLLAILIAAAVIVTGFATCCLGFLLLAVPYVGTVVLLPVLVTYRAFTVDFLGQMDAAVRLEPRATAPEAPA